MKEQIIMLLLCGCFYGLGFIFGHIVGWNKCYKIVKELKEQNT